MIRQSRLRRLGLIALALAVLLPVTGPSSAAPDTGPVRRVLNLTGYPDHTVAVPAHMPLPDTATGIGPGSLIITEIPGEGTFGCTANFIWEGNGRTFLGSAGHCFLPETKTATHGSGNDYDARGVKTRVCVSGCVLGSTVLGFGGQMVELGPVAYARQTGDGGDIGNDFGLVEIPAGANIRASMAMWGGPVRHGPLAVGDITCHYGNGLGLGEVYLTKGRLGTAGLFSDEVAWFAATASTPGDSGAAMATCRQDANGVHGDKAIGVLTHLSSLGIAGTTMSRAKTLAGQAGLLITARLG
ncbi:MAG: hypothetical protein ACR2H3_10595 [Acidimicrobiales bacterium]